MKLIFFLSFSLSFWTSIFYAQNDIVYLDENNFVIDEGRYVKKLNYDIYYALSHHTDSSTYKKVYLSYRIGKLSKPVKNSLFKRLKQMNNIDTLKSIHIHYFKNPNHTMNTNDSIRYMENHKYNKTILNTTYIEHHKKCSAIRNWDKIEHFYSSENSLSTKKDQRWNEDYQGFLEKIFFNDDVNNNVKKIYIRPDGSYFVVNTILNNKIHNDLLRNRNWEKHQREFERKYHLLN